MKKMMCFMISIIFIIMIYSFGDKDNNRTKDEHYLPIIRPENFISSVTNPFLPFIPGTKFTYREKTNKGTETGEVSVTNETILILGVKCTVVSDILKSDKGDILESTSDWYAQDKDGNVWYFGEDTREYVKGKVSSTEGSWKAGVNGAQPGLVMPAKPILGIPYRQEYLFNEAEDMGKVISTSETVTVPTGTYNNCILTEEWSPLEPDVVEQKYYATGIGNIKTIMIKGGYEVSELTEKK
jgi:hypothetical protein